MPSRPWDRLDPELLRRALSAHANLPVTPASSQAAVSVVLAPVAAGVDVLLIRRAARATDPWSSHMAFPGGFRSASDPDLYATALRETREEVGIDLTRDAALLGCLPDVSPASARVSVRPFVFATERIPAISTNDEVDAIAWANVGAIARNDFPATYELEVGSTRQSFPGFRVVEHVVWGMTYRVLMELVAAAAHAVSIDQQGKG